MKLLLDIKYALRLLGKSPGFTLLTIIMLAGGLGVSIFTYSFLNTAMFKPLPISDGDRVYKLFASADGQRRLLDAYELNQVRQNNSTLEEIGAYINSTVILSAGDIGRSYTATRAEWNLFDFSRAQSMLGRGFQPEDNRAGAEPVAVLSYRVWENFFDSDADIIGRLIDVDNVATRIIGVMPEDYGFPVSSDLWLPLSAREIQPGALNEVSVNAYARVRPGATREQAEAELNALIQRIQQQLPRDRQSQPVQTRAFLQTFQEAQVPDALPLFIALYLLSAFILMLAAINVGNMLLARATARRKETAIRVALGAPRWRLVVQMMWESIIICVVGGVVAILLAGWVLQLINLWANVQFEGGLAFWWRWGLDLSTVITAICLVLATIVIAGFLPAWRATAADFIAILRDGTRGSVGRGVGRLTEVLVILQVVMISVIIFLGLLLSFASHSLTNVDFGIDTQNALAAPVSLDSERYATDAERLLYYRRLQNQLTGAGSIRSLTVMSEIGFAEHSYALQGSTYQYDSDYPLAYARAVSPNLKDLGIELRDGRYFDERDRSDGAAVALISESLAQRHWPGQSALGARLRLVDPDQPAEEWFTVVGVVSDVLNGNPLSKRRSNLAIYRPLGQVPGARANLVIKYRGDEQSARSELYQTMAQVDPEIKPSQVINFEDMLNQSALLASSATDVLLKSALFAMLLAISGIYGLTANSVTRRTHEIGLRRALGATDNRIIRLLMVQGGKQLIWGLGIALVIDVLASLMLSRMLVISPLTYFMVALIVPVIIAAVVLVAIYVPASKAVKLEPADALRYE